MLRASSSDIRPVRAQLISYGLHMFTTKFHLLDLNRGKLLAVFNLLIFHRRSLMRELAAHDGTVHFNLSMALVKILVNWLFNIWIWHSYHPDFRSGVHWDDGIVHKRISTIFNLFSSIMLIQNSSRGATNPRTNLIRLQNHHRLQQVFTIVLLLSWRLLL